MIIGVSHVPAGEKRIKHVEPVEVDDVYMLGEIVCRYPITLATFKDNHRCQAKFIQSSLVGLDFDEGVPLNSFIVRARSLGLQYVIGTTKSHQIEKDGKPPCDRFRAFFPAYSTASLEIFRHNLRLLTRAFKADRACKDGARVFFPIREIVDLSDKGQLYRWSLPDYAAIARREAEAKEARQKYIRSGIVPNHIRRMLQDGVPQGGRNNACYRIGAELQRYGFGLNQVINMVMESPLSALPEQEIILSCGNGWRKAEQDEKQSPAVVSGT